MSSTATVSNTTAPTQFLKAGDNTYAYRQFGSGSGVPLLFLQHFTGTLNNWDPGVTDPLALGRAVILFESAGIGRSSGKVPETVAGMADHAMKFLDVLGLARVDVLGFSLGGMVAQAIALKRPTLLRRIVLTGTGPEGGVGVAMDRPELRHHDSHRQFVYSQRASSQCAAHHLPWLWSRSVVSARWRIHQPCVRVPQSQ